MNEELQKAYLYIKEIMYAAFRVATVLTEYPYENINDMAKGLRNILIKNYNTEENRKYFTNIVPKVGNHLFYAKSGLGFSTIVYITPEKYGHGVISVGPFMNQEMDNGIIKEILHTNGFEIGYRKMIYKHYQTLPVINENAVIHTLSILLTQELELQEPIKQIRQTNQKIESEQVRYKSSLDDEITKEKIMEYRETHNILLNAVSQGNIEAAEKTFPWLLSGNMEKSNLSFRKMKLFAHSLNVKCETVLLSGDIHPFYVKKLSAELEEQIEKESKCSELEGVCYQILQKYCQLVNHCRLPNHSKTVRDAVNYIQLHVCEPLTLAVLAEKLGKSRPFLSSEFKKETRKTITEYIHEYKMQYAAMLLYLPDISIQDVAIQVGINDVSYFIKMYKKYTGLTPGEYRKKFYL